MGYTSTWLSIANCKYGVLTDTPSYQFCSVQHLLWLVCFICFSKMKISHGEIFVYAIHSVNYTMILPTMSDSQQWHPFLCLKVIQPHMGKIIFIYLSCLQPLQYGDRDLFNSLSFELCSRFLHHTEMFLLMSWIILKINGSSAAFRNSRAWRNYSFPFNVNTMLLTIELSARWHKGQNSNLWITHLSIYKT